MLTVQSFQEDPAPLAGHHQGVRRQRRRSRRRISCDVQKRDRLRDTERVAAELRTRRLVRVSPILHQWHVVSVLLRWTQHSIILRERARLKQALLYSRLRRIALALGDRLVDDGRLERADDIFFLTRGGDRRAGLGLRDVPGSPAPAGGGAPAGARGPERDRASRFDDAGGRRVFAGLAGRGVRSSADGRRRPSTRR